MLNVSPGIDQPTFITHIHVIITLDSLVTNLVSVDFDVWLLYRLS